MPEPVKPFDIHDYLGIALRRKWYIIIPLILSLGAFVGLYKYLPKVYRASTLILVQSQKIPESYVRATVTDSISERLITISEEILSRTRLEKVIGEFDLYPELRNKTSMEDIVEMMRGAVQVKVHYPVGDSGRSRGEGQNTFSVSYEGRDPRTVMMVTTKLAALFIEENLKVREMRAEWTSEFIIKELSGMEDQLKRKEQDVRSYKERFMGELPQQLEANLRILERLQLQLQMANESMRAAEEKAALIQNQMDETRQRRRVRRTPGSRPDDPNAEIVLEDDLITEWNNLKKELAIAQSKYTDNHPDVIALKKKISQLEPKVRELLADLEKTGEASSGGRAKKKGGENLGSYIPDPNTERLMIQYREQYNNFLLESKRAREEVKKLKEQFALYERRIEEAPKREQELTLLTRDYDLLKNNYQSLLDKKIQAQMAENLERKQQGEQFKVLDPARIPGKPIRPDRNRMLLMGAVLGLLVGFGLAWFRESLDKSFHTVSDVETYLGIPVLATIPNLKDSKGSR